MTYVVVIIVFCSLPAGLGVIIDRLLLNRHKGRLHNALLRYWNYLDDLSLSDIWRVFAIYAIRFFTKVFGKKFLSFRCIVKIVLVSFTLTWSALCFISFFEYHEIPKEAFHWTIIILLLINLIFDALTGLVTIKVLSVIRRSTPIKAVALIIIDVILALSFAIGCLTSAHFLYGEYDIHEHETLGDFASDVYYIATDLITYPLSQPEDRMNTPEFLFSCTTFIPTLIYSSILVTLIISKAVLEIVIRITKYLLEAATEVKESKNLAVFTLTGSLFSVIVLFLTVFKELCEIF